MSDMNHILLGIFLLDLCKHVFIGAMPGHYKSSLLRYLFISLFKRDIPTIVFEPGKREYRTMKAMVCAGDPYIARFVKSLKIFTPGNKTISPVTLNSLILGKIPVSQKISDIVETICASGDFFDPLPQIIYEALTLEYYYYLYEKGPLPHIGRLFKRCVGILNKRYGPEVRDNLKGALSSRLSQLSNGFSAVGQIFCCGETIPSIASLVTGYSIIELKSLGKDAFPLVVLQYLRSIRDYVEHTPWLDKSKPRLVIILEEAHLFFPGLTDNKIAEKVVEYICNMLNELRALGVAMILCDQSPSALPLTVLKATGAKIIGRQVEGGDRQIIADCMMLNETQRDGLAFLLPREFYFLGESYRRVVKIRVPNIYEEISIPYADKLLDDKLIRYIKDDTWFKNCREARVSAELKLLAQKLHDFSVDADKLRSDIIKMLSDRKKLRREMIIKKAVQYDWQIDDQLRDFHMNYLIPLAGVDDNAVYKEPHKSFRINLLDGFERTRSRLNRCQDLLKKYTKV